MLVPRRVYFIFPQLEVFPTSLVSQICENGRNLYECIKFCSDPKHFTEVPGG